MTREDQIKKAAEIIAYGCSDELEAALIKDFPELTESEDERIRKSIIQWLNTYKEGNPLTICDREINSWIAYLERQKEQRHAEWSGEDEKYLNLAINIVASDFGEDSPTISWLKSIRPQPHWKPSEEQMEALSDAYVEASTFKQGDILESLYDDLKKL